MKQTILYLQYKMNKLMSLEGPQKAQNTVSDVVDG